MPTGTHVYLAVQATLDEQLHALVAKRDEEAFRILPELVEPFGIDPRSRRLQAAVKSLRTEREKSPTEIAQHFKSRIRELADTPTDAVYKFALTAMGLLGSLDSDLFMERSKISTVSAILRPLDVRWAQRLRNAGEIFDYDGIQIAENSLRNQVVSNERDLELWFAYMYEAFERFCIFYPGQTKSKPMGMIRATNRRMYSRNWVEWTASVNNIHRVLELAADIEAERPVITSGVQRQNLPAYGTRLRNVGNDNPSQYSRVERHDAYAPSRQVAKEVQTLEDKCTVTLTSTNNPNQTSIKSWPDVSSLKKHVENWLLVTAETWAEEGTLVNFTIQKHLDDSIVSVQSRTPKQAVESILKLVDL